MVNTRRCRREFIGIDPTEKNFVLQTFTVCKHRRLTADIRLILTDFSVAKIVSRPKVLRKDVLSTGVTI